MWDKLFLNLLRRTIRTGRLTLTLPDNSTHHIGDGEGPDVTVRITDPALSRRFLINPELAIGEAYMDGALTIENDDLHGLIALGNGNIPERGIGLEALIWPVFRTFQQYNPIHRAQRNVAHHYDLSSALYELFLDEDWQYSCGYFKSPEDSLERAQDQKKALIATKLLLAPGQRVLDIGCGWGGLAMTLAQRHGVHVVGVTLSREQHKVARERVAAAGLDDQIDIRLCDYRHVTESFDRVVSVGMFEHVGQPHYREFFSHVRNFLTEDGIALIHTIGRSTPPSRTSPWIAKYIFPGGYIPALSETARAIEKEGLWLTDLEVWRLHYAETLKHWHARFSENEAKARALYDERFCRMWRFYLVASEMTFRTSRQCVFQLQLARRQDAVPLTRDYLCARAG